MKKVYATRFMVEADVIKSILEDNGICCMLWDKRIGTAYPVVNIRVMVEEKDFEKAKEIIRSYQKKDRG